MIVYSATMLATAVLFVIFGILIMRGRASLINCYREERVKDKDTYCIKMGRALLIMGAGMAVSGVTAIFSDKKSVILIALAVTLCGVIIGTCRLFFVQKKYGGGVF